MNSLVRLVAWCNNKQQEQDVDRDTLLMVEDITKVLSVVRAAQRTVSMYRNEEWQKAHADLAAIRVIDMERALAKVEK